MLTNIVSALERFTLGDFLDILLVTIILYSFFLLIKDTKAYQMAIGLAIVGALFFITQWGKLAASHWIIRNFINYLIIAIIVLFQNEIRKFLTSIGSQSFRRAFSTKSLKDKFEDLFFAVDYLSARKIGALIAIEKEISLKSYADKGTKIDAVLSKDLLVSLFFPHSPLHDGAVIIKGNQIVSAGALLPLPASHNLGEAFLTRTRHLAALGLSQETDAAVIVVSEETGGISLAAEGKLQRGLSKEQLREKLFNFFR
jgi:diadenylate cyclase